MRSSGATKFLLDGSRGWRAQSQRPSAFAGPSFHDGRTPAACVLAAVAVITSGSDGSTATLASSPRRLIAEEGRVDIISLL